MIRDRPGTNVHEAEDLERLHTRAEMIGPSHQHTIDTPTLADYQTNVFPRETTREVFDDERSDSSHDEETNTVRCKQCKHRFKINCNRGDKCTKCQRWICDRGFTLSMHGGGKETERNCSRCYVESLGNDNIDPITLLQGENEGRTQLPTNADELRQDTRGVYAHSVYIYPTNIGSEEGVAPNASTTLGASVRADNAKAAARLRRDKRYQQHECRHELFISHKQTGQSSTLLKSCLYLKQSVIGLRSTRWTIKAYYDSCTDTGRLAEVAHLDPQCRKLKMGHLVLLDPKEESTRYIRYCPECSMDPVSYTHLTLPTILLV